MGRTVSIGAQGFESIIERKYFYVDKTEFIKEWWESGDSVTLITRPRRFGKTLNMSMLECFFSTKYEGRSDLFEGLKIWQNEKYREIQGTFPVIFLSFADIKSKTYKSALIRIKENISDLYRKNRFLIEGDALSEDEKEYFLSALKNIENEAAAETAVRRLAEFMTRYYGKKAIILLDEYDTPMQEAWLSGYWDDIVAFMRNFFNATFKTNPYLERAVMTGITRVSKESIFSDLNNLKVVTTTGYQYETCFGFTEEEVFDALDEMGMSKEKADVKEWYDGFIFGRTSDIYNPWSITNFLNDRMYGTYWADTSSNGLISKLLQKSGKNMKQDFESLIQGKSIEKSIDEQIVFNQLEGNEEAIWSLMVASGYLKVDEYSMDLQKREKKYVLSITNIETLIMFEKMTSGWFGAAKEYYNDFIKAMLRNNLEEMNIYMNEVALDTFSNFDSGSKPSERTEPERFYHGFVLGLLVDLRGRYEVKSNRESGYGRYDVCLIPLNESDPGIIIEFKVFNAKKEKNLEETVEAALKQIEEKKYDSILVEKGISQDRIHHYGFAFEGKTVVIGNEELIMRN